MITPKDSFSTDNIIDAKSLGAFGGGLGGGERRTPEIVENFSKNSLPYFERLNTLRNQTLLNFDSRGGDFYKNVLDHFSTNYQGNSYFNNAQFAVNAGNPAGGQTRALIDLPLSDVSLGYFNKNYIGMDILTPSPVMERTGHVGRYGNEHNNPPSGEQIRAEGRANVKQLNPVSRDFLNYHVGSYALKDSLSPDDYRNMMRPFDAESDVVIALKEILMLICEIEIAGFLTDTTNYPTNSVRTLANANERFDVPSSSSIDKEVGALRNAIRTECGVDPNVAVMDANTFESVSRHPQARGTIFNTMSTERTASEAEVMKLLQVDKLLIGKTSRTTSNSPTALPFSGLGQGYLDGLCQPTKGHQAIDFWLLPSLSQC